MTVPVHLVGGFLGAGKTTTVRRALACLPGRSAVIVNDFGEAAVDAEELAQTGVRVANIAGTCICCTAPENFVGAMRAILDEVRPDRVFVEPTGLARTSDLVDTLRRPPLRDRVLLAPVVVIVDPRVVARGTDGDLLRAQAEVADVLVVNGGDRATSAEIEACDRWIAALWPGPAQVVHTKFGDVPHSLWDASAAREAPPSFRFGGASTGGFIGESRTWPATVRFGRSALDRALRALPELVRFKGVFLTDEGVFRWDLTGDAWQVAPSDHRRGSACDAIARAGADLSLALAAVDAARDSVVEVDAGLDISLADGRVVTVDQASLARLPGGVPDLGAVLPGRVGVGARVEALLSALNAPLDASVVVVARDGFVTAPVPRAALREALVAYALDGAPLPSDLGGPYRWFAVDPAAKPCANVKGVARVVVR